MCVRVERRVAERPIMSHAFVERTSGGQAACACGEVPIALCAFKISTLTLNSAAETRQTLPPRRRSRPPPCSRPAAAAPRPLLRSRAP